MPRVITYSKSGPPTHVHFPCYFQFCNIKCSFDRHCKSRSHEILQTLKIKFTRDLLAIVKGEKYVYVFSRIFNHQINLFMVYRRHILILFMLNLGNGWLGLARELCLAWNEFPRELYLWNIFSFPALFLYIFGQIYIP